MTKLYAPWTPEQVRRLNAWQDCAWVRPFVCGAARADPAHQEWAAYYDTVPGRFVAQREGWRCPVCNSRQTWAHDFMFAGPPPKPTLSQPEETTHEPEP